MIFLVTFLVAFVTLIMYSVLANETDYDRMIDDLEQERFIKNMDDGYEDERYIVRSDDYEE